MTPEELEIQIIRDRLHRDVPICRHDARMLLSEIDRLKALLEEVRAEQVER